LFPFERCALLHCALLSLLAACWALVTAAGTVANTHADDDHCRLCRTHVGCVCVQHMRLRVGHALLFRARRALVAVALPRFRCAFCCTDANDHTPSLQARDCTALLPWQALIDMSPLFCAVLFVCVCICHGCCCSNSLPPPSLLSRLLYCLYLSSPNRMQMAAPTPVRIFRGGVHIRTFAHNSRFETFVPLLPPGPPSTRVNSLIQRGVFAAAALTYVDGEVAGGDYDVEDGPIPLPAGSVAGHSSRLCQIVGRRLYCSPLHTRSHSLATRHSSRFVFSPSSN
jgi:hypothetical protein